MGSKSGIITKPRTKPLILSSRNPPCQHHPRVRSFHNNKKTAIMTCNFVVVVVVAYFVAQKSLSRASATRTCEEIRAGPAWTMRSQSSGQHSRSNPRPVRMWSFKQGPPRNSKWHVWQCRARNASVTPEDFLFVKSVWLEVPKLPDTILGVASAILPSPQKGACLKERRKVVPEVPGSTRSIPYKCSIATRTLRLSFWRHQCTTHITVTERG